MNAGLAGVHFVFLSGNSCAVAVLVFFSAAAGTRVVAAYLGIDPDWLWFWLLLGVLLFNGVFVSGFG